MIEDGKRVSEFQARGGGAKNTVYCLPGPLSFLILLSGGKEEDEGDKKSLLSDAEIPKSTGTFLLGIKESLCSAGMEKNLLYWVMRKRNKECK